MLEHLGSLTEETEEEIEIRGLIKVSMDDDGWTAEMKIPFSQLSSRGSHLGIRHFVRKSNINYSNTLSRSIFLSLFSLIR